MKCDQSNVAIDSLWTQDRHGVNRLHRDGIEYVVVAYEQCASTTMIGARRAQRKKGETTFLVPAAPIDYPHDRTGEEIRFWNCGTVERAVCLSKHYVTADSDAQAVMRQHYKDVSKLDISKLLSVQ